MQFIRDKSLKKDEQLFKLSLLRCFVLLILCINSSSQLFSQVIKVNSEPILYKEVDTVKLYLHQFKAKDFDAAKEYNTIIFIHGGGWNQGKWQAFQRQSMYFASRGMMCFSIEYRVKNRHNTTPFDATQDVHDAYNYILDYADKLNVNKNAIVVGGGSAGGHLAMTLGFWGGNEILPAAMLLFNPVVSTGPSGFGYNRMEGKYQEISPIDNINADTPASIIMVGTQDKVLPVPMAEKYKAQMEQKLNKCVLQLYQDQTHAFFNKMPYFAQTLNDCDEFLQGMGLLKGSSTVYEQYQTH